MNYEEVMEYMQRAINRKMSHIHELLEQYMGERVLPSILDKQMSELYSMIAGQRLLRDRAAERDIELFAYDMMNMQNIAEQIIPWLIEADQKGGR